MTLDMMFWVCRDSLPPLRIAALPVAEGNDLEQPDLAAPQFDVQTHQT